jgi:hypothetical protein
MGVLNMEERFMRIGGCIDFRADDIRIVSTVANEKRYIPMMLYDAILPMMQIS